ncbi:hypothetical protein [Streptomyces sp. V2]|uniref:hypothetical protein n=1 Tax=Streptomyces sp. V2 TaxID=1424099 RepID=UPI001402B0AD|nr:hypothetical protein [Streptomyces sp. V2]
MATPRSAPAMKAAGTSCGRSERAGPGSSVGARCAEWYAVSAGSGSVSEAAVRVRSRSRTNPIMSSIIEVLAASASSWTSL